MAGIDLHGTCVDFPIFDAKSRFIEEGHVGLDSAALVSAALVSAG